MKYSAETATVRTVPIGSARVKPFQYWGMPDGPIGAVAVGPSPTAPRSAPITIETMPRRIRSTIQATTLADVLENVRPGATSWTTGTGAAQPTPGGRPVPAGVRFGVGGVAAGGGTVTGCGGSGEDQPAGV